ncbi:DNA repair protein XRCC4 [Ambystoma mexicanum]|uniref:DNA repair protein XRCC4 n=1 Tax=Ambystoma mexicanum TaxID=8296 RepID=UPI0037E84E03
MEKRVSQICLASEPGKQYFLQLLWEGGLGLGFQVTLCDGLSAWSGQVSGQEVCRDAADMEMPLEKYVQELSQALTPGPAQATQYHFDLTQDEPLGDCYHLSYDKHLKDVLFRLGSVQLRSVQSPAEVTRALILHCLQASAELQEQNQHLQRENQRLLADWADMQGHLEAWVRSKEGLEQDLYTRFTLVLNEKKAKIRSLQEKLKQAQEKVNTSPGKAPPPPKGDDEDYSGSTDEESKNHAVPSKVETAVSRRNSLLSSTDDIPDVAPTRKHRQRVQKRAGQEDPAASEEPTAQEKKKCEPVAPKKAGRRPSRGKRSLETTDRTEDPDDLFNDM